MKICLDAGHGINTAGKKTPVFTSGVYKGKQIREAQQNYPVMEKLGEYLKYNGFEVVYTNTDINTDMSLSNRTTKANKFNADLFISIHKNAFTGKWQTSAKGIETLYYSTSTKGKKLANNVQNSLIKETGMYNRKIKNTFDYLAVLKNTKMPAILVELGFMDFLEDANQMLDTTCHKKFAKAICKGVCEYAGVTYKEEIEETVDKNTFYRVVAGSYNSKANAEKQVEKLKQQVEDVFIDVYKK